MIAAHLENLLFLLLLVVAGLFQLLGRVARKTSEEEEEPTPKPARRMPKPIPRAPAQSDQERIRKFLEALGQPASSPPPVMPRTDIPPRPLAPVTPPTARLPAPWKLTREERRKRYVVLRESPPQGTVTRVEKIFPPATTGAPIFEVHEGPLPVEPPPITKAPVEAYPAPKAFGLPRGAYLKTDIATLLASKSALRDAIILREIFGPPRSLQALDLL